MENGVNMEHTFKDDEFFYGVLAERYARIFIAKIGVTIGIIQIDTMTEVMAQPLIIDKNLRFFDGELVELPKQEIYSALLKKMQKERLDNLI